MRKKDLDPDPLRQFEKWYGEALASGYGLPEAVALATASSGGVPSVRMVLFKGISKEGLEFFTNYNSRKGREIRSNPQAAMVFWWERLHRQVLLAGRVEKVETKRSDDYFATRPRGSQIGAWASGQSQVISGRQELKLRADFFRAKYRGRKVPRPPHWGGFRLIPYSVEFWQARVNRLHDRLRYRRSLNRNWILERLAP